MKKIEFNRENIEQEGYILRVEEGVTYIEKEGKINNYKYGECFLFFQQKIELDKKGKEIVTQVYTLYKENEGKKQNLESNELMFEGEDLVLESMTIYLEKDGSMYYKKVQNFIDKKDTTILFQNTDQLRIKSIRVSNIDDKICDSFIEFDEKGLTIREEKLIKVENIDQKKSIVTIEQNIKGDIKTIEDTYINNKRTYSRWFNKKGDITAELKINGEVEDWTYYGSNKNIKKTIIKEIEEGKERGIEKTTFYHESGGIISTTKRDEDNVIEKITTYYESGGIRSLIEEENGIEKITYYYESGGIRSLIEKESGIEKTTYYHESGGISSITEKDIKKGKSTRVYYCYNDNGYLDYKIITEKDKDGKIIDERYSKKRGRVTEEYYKSPLAHIMYANQYITLRTIEDLKGGGKKITEKDTVTYEYKDEKIICTYREKGDGTIRQKIIERERERVVIQFNLDGKWTSILRNIKNSTVPIEEFYKKGNSFPTFKVEGIEIPLDNLDKYKDICKKYNIAPLSDVLEAHEPKKDIKSTVKSFIDFFKR